MLDNIDLVSSFFLLLGHDFVYSEPSKLPKGEGSGELYNSDKDPYKIVDMNENFEATSALDPSSFSQFSEGRITSRPRFCIFRTVKIANFRFPRQCLAVILH
jgi:hypothetical protein